MPKKKKTVKSKTGETRKKVDFKTSVSFHEHEDDQHCSTSYCDGAIIFKPKEIKQKLMIASNILLECKEVNKKLMSGKNPDVKVCSIIKKLAEYTNLSTNELKSINDSVRTRDRTFAKALKDIKVIQYPTYGLMADDIRRIFFEFIVNQKKFPSKMDLLKQLKKLMSKYTNEAMPIQRLVKNKLVKYRHFPEFNRYLLTEHPESIYERSVYLNSMKEFRSQERNFIYVEVRRIIPRSAAAAFIAGLAAFPQSGKLEKFFTKDSDDLIAKKWLQQRILPLVAEHSVVVLTQPKRRNKQNINGKRYHLVSWLDEHGVPYGNNPHTAELYNLYEKFRRKLRPTEAYDHVFLNAGLTVVHCPAEWRELNFFKQVWQQINVMDSYHTGRPEALKQTILNATQMIEAVDTTEASLVETEYKMLKEDCAMEEIVEKVLEMVKKGEVQVLEFPKECCGDQTDYFETHVGDIVLDNQQE